MALKLGQNYRLLVTDPATPGEFLTIGGEQRLSRTDSPNAIDGASKDDGNYQVELYGQQKVSITVSGKVKLPDAGLKALDGLAKVAGSSDVVKIVDTTDDTDVFVCEMSVGQRQVDFDNQQVATYSFNLSIAAAPTTDALFG
ncbi:phage tail tube protein [Qipengyuania sp.]|uniref:phage tail tube protein n=1 Tax=Qipengyuania sp. TaxID=2004515 RepID=UPI0035C85692